jgi:hypothetical protein
MFHMSSSSDSTDSSVLLQFSACATCWFLRTPGKGFSYAVHSLRRWPWPACSFCGTQTARFLEFPIPLSFCFVRRWFCMILGSKTTLHDVSTLLPPSGEMGNLAMAQDTRRKFDYFFFSLTRCCPLWASLSLSYRPPKSRRELWNTRYFLIYFSTHVLLWNISVIQFG